MKILNKVVCSLLIAIPVIAYPTGNRQVEVVHAQSQSHAVNTQKATVTEPTAEKVEVQEQPIQTEPPKPSAEDEAKVFIYFKESSNNPNATNPGGCYGLGQDCNGLVKDKCGADYACQDAFFTAYMIRRYTTWSAAKSFWLSKCGTREGCWW